MDCIPRYKISRIFQNYFFVLELEKKIGLEPYFTKNHFGKREDGFWCVKPNGTESVELECMPSNKGGKKFDDENRYTISGLVQKSFTQETNQLLTEFMTRHPTFQFSTSEKPTF